MKDTVGQQAASILVGVRDNLLKPMATEIEGLQRENHEAVLRSLSEQTKVFSGKIDALQKEVADLRAQIETLNGQLVEAAAKVKWNE